MKNSTNQNTSQEREINLLDLAKKLWAKRKFIFKCSFLGFALGLVIAFSIPREYTSSVVLAPESTASSSLGGASALAAMAGVNLNTGSMEDLSPDIYPSILQSTSFIIGLSEINLNSGELGSNVSLFEYIDKYLSKPWWGYLLSFPRTIKASLRSEDVVKEKNDTIDGIFILSEKEAEVIDEIKDRISIEVDKKTGIITLSSTMQNPEVSAYLANTLTSYLQSYVIRYRTEKARADLVFSEKLYKEAQADYTFAQQRYADFLDKNQNVILASYKVNQEKLQNEVSLAYSVYNQVAQQLQLAKVKVQDQTPVYSTIQPAIVPLIPSKPNKKLIIIGFVLLSAAGACMFILRNYFL